MTSRSERRPDPQTAPRFYLPSFDSNDPQVLVSGSCSKRLRTPAATGAIHTHDLGAEAGRNVQRFLRFNVTTINSRYVVADRTFCGK